MNSQEAKVDVASALQEWLARWSQKWRGLSIAAELKITEDSAVNKAAATLESPTYVASITAWGSGTVEFIVLDVATRRETTINDKEYTTLEELRRVLDECANDFSRLNHGRCE